MVAQEVDGGVEFGEGAFQAAEAGFTVGGLDRRGAGFEIVARDLFKKVDHLIQVQAILLQACRMASSLTNRVPEPAEMRGRRPEKKRGRDRDPFR